MLPHDRYARVTPFEVAFPEADRLRTLSAAVSEEAARRRVDPSELDGFAALAAVGEFIEDLHGPAAARADLLEYAALAFHAIHFLEFGSKVYLLTTSAARDLVDVVPEERPEPPSPAGYLQLPQHLFWTSGGSGSPPESVDGMFWSVSGAGLMRVLVVTGLRPDRPGFGTIGVSEAPIRHAAEWMRSSARQHEKDFASTLPGAQLDRLHSIETAGEVLKPLARFFAKTASASASLEPSVARGAVEDGEPRPSALPFTRVSLAA